MVPNIISPAIHYHAATLPARRTGKVMPYVIDGGNLLAKIPRQITNIRQINQTGVSTPASCWYLCWHLWRVQHIRSNRLRNDRWLWHWRCLIKFIDLALFQLIVVAGTGVKRSKISDRG